MGPYPASALNASVHFGGVGRGRVPGGCVGGGVAETRRLRARDVCPAGRGDGPCRCHPFKVLALYLIISLCILVETPQINLNYGLKLPSPRLWWSKHWGVQEPGGGGGEAGGGTANPPS
jgi:hypothetical protein